MGREGFKAEYTVKAWKDYVKSMDEQLKSLGWESMEELEKAHWSWAILRRYEGAEEGVKGDQATKTATKEGKGKRKVEVKTEEAVERKVGEEEEIVVKPSSSRAERAAKRVKAGNS